MGGGEAMAVIGIGIGIGIKRRASLEDGLEFIAAGGA